MEILEVESADRVLFIITVSDDLPPESEDDCTADEKQLKSSYAHIEKTFKSKCPNCEVVIIANANVQVVRGVLPDKNEK